MQGFGLMLKAMGIDPVTMMSQLQAEFGPQVEAYGDALVLKLREEIVTPLMTKLDSLDAAIKEINPNYIPDDFKSGDVEVLPKLTLEPVTNPGLPDGGAVDPATLDPVRMASQGSLEDQAALQPLTEQPSGDLSSLETGNGQGAQPEALEPVPEPEADPAPAAAEPDPFAEVRDPPQAEG